MKKIFTLAAILMVAMGANAQESWTVTEADLANVKNVDNTNPGIILHDRNDVLPLGTSEDDAKVAAITNTSTEKLQDQTLEVSTDNVTMKAVSTLNLPDMNDDDELVVEPGWELISTDNEALRKDSGFTVDFTSRIKAKSGNPELKHIEFWEENSDGDAVHRVKGEYWAPGATTLPAKGCYIELTSKTAGTLECGIRINKGSHMLYIIDESTLQPIAPANIDVKFYYQNNTFVYDEATGAKIVEGKLADDYIIQHTNGLTQNRPALGTVKFNVEAGKTYMMMSPKSQIDFYGFVFNAATNGINTVSAAKKFDVNAPIFNLAGQRVSKAYKGVVIQNGRKFIQK